MQSTIYASWFIIGIILGVIVTLAIIFFSRKENKKYYIKKGLYYDYDLYEYDMNTREKNLICGTDQLILYGINFNDFKDLKPYETRRVYINTED